jgi:hypothetical protein
MPTDNISLLGKLYMIAPPRFSIFILLGLVAVFLASLLMFLVLTRKDRRR